MMLKADPDARSPAVKRLLAPLVLEVVVVGTIYF